MKGEKTLFVVGIKPAEEIYKILTYDMCEGVRHIYLGTSQCFTLDTQRQLFADYIAGIQQMRAAGTPIDLIFWSSLVDGASATNALEKTSGAYNSAWTVKPAGQVILNQVGQPW